MLTVRFGLTLVMAMLVSANVGCGCKAKPRPTSYLESPAWPSPSDYVDGQTAAPAEAVTAWALTSGGRSLVWPQRVWQHLLWSQLCLVSLRADLVE